MGEKAVNPYIERIKDSLRYYFATNKFRSRYRIPLAPIPFEIEDILELLESLLSMELTMGKKVETFENKWSQYLNAKHTILVNSGTSANLLAVSVLSNPSIGDRRVKPGDRIITTPVTFPSSVYPLVQIGAIPVFVDVELDTLNMDPDLVEVAIDDRVKGILAVHFMGNPCDMDVIVEIAKEHNLFLIEDACEAHGAEFRGKKVGTFGDIGTFSFFFSHHISTVEGGALVTNDDDYNMIGRMLRSYGWIRSLPENVRKTIISKYKHIDPRHLYENIGYNFKPTELTAALGIHQIDRLDNVIEIKRKNAQYLIKELGSLPLFEEFFILPSERQNTKHSWLGFPIVVRKDAPFDKFDVMNYLEEKGIETRQLEAGNVVQQPSAKLYLYKKVGELSNAEIVMRGGFFFGNHHQMSSDDLNYIVEVFEEFLRTIRR